MRRGFIITALIIGLIATIEVSAQQTQFSYQGSLNISGAPANGSYDFEFVLYDAPKAGNQVGSVLTQNGVQVSNGIFAVALDFGNVFPGAARFLEIRVRPAGQPGITVLSRQVLDSTPYAIKSANAASADAISSSCVGCISASQIGSVSGAAVSGAIPVASVPTGSGNYIQNRATPQAGTNFNISGNGTVAGTLNAGIVNAVQYNYAGGRLLTTDFSAGTLSLGLGAGNLSSTGTANTFLGPNAGGNNTTGWSNTFVGPAGASNTTGHQNAFFGYAAGSENTIGNDNAFFGRSAGHFNVSGSNNAFFGYAAGYNNLASGNAFFGYHAGRDNNTGVNNAFFGVNAGAANTTALGNSFFGANAGAANLTAMGNSFFGASAGLINNGANNSFFGTVAGVANTSGFANSFFGHWAGHDNTTGDNNTFVGRSAGEFMATGNANTFIGYNSGGDNDTSGSNNTLLGAGTLLTTSNQSFATAIGAGAQTFEDNMIVLGRLGGFDNVMVWGSLRVSNLGAAGNTPLCRNQSITIATCSSSLRYKTAVENFGGGLDIVRRLRPISFRWRDGGMRDVGFAAEEVAEVEALLATYNDKGEIEGVKYGQVTTVLVNAVKEQQAEIESQRREISDLRSQVDALKKVVCATNATADACKP